MREKRLHWWCWECEGRLQFRVSWSTGCLFLQAGASGMRGKLAVYRELQDNMSEGLRFYMSLQEAINTLRQQSGDYVLTRSMQRYLDLPLPQTGSPPASTPALAQRCAGDSACSCKAVSCAWMVEGMQSQHLRG